MVGCGGSISYCIIRFRRITQLTSIDANTKGNIIYIIVAAAHGITHKHSIRRWNTVDERRFTSGA